MGAGRHVHRNVREAFHELLARRRAAKINKGSVLGTTDVLSENLRSIDPTAQRPGMPPHMAALVDKVGADSAHLTLVNTDPVDGHPVLIQAGSFGEHEFTEAWLENQEGQEERIEVKGKYLQVHLGPAAQARLHLGLKRFAPQPSYELPAFA